MPLFRSTSDMITSGLTSYSFSYFSFSFSSFFSFTPPPSLFSFPSYGSLPPCLSLPFFSLSPPLPPPFCGSLPLVSHLSLIPLLLSPFLPLSLPSLNLPIFTCQQIGMKMLAFGPLKGYFHSWRNMLDFLLSLVGVGYIICAVIYLIPNGNTIVSPQTVV